MQSVVDTLPETLLEGSAPPAQTYRDATIVYVPLMVLSVGGIFPVD